MCRKFHNAFNDFGFLVCPKPSSLVPGIHDRHPSLGNMSVCSFHISFSDVTCASELLFLFFCGDCEEVGVGVFIGIYVGVLPEVILKKEG